MTTNLAKSASNNGQIIKSWLPNDRRAKFLPSVAEIAYDWLRVGGHLGNVGLEYQDEKSFLWGGKLEARTRDLSLLLFFILLSLLFNLDRVALGEYSYIPNGDTLGWDVSLRMAFLNGVLQGGGSDWLPGLLSGIDATANAHYPNFLTLLYSMLPVWAATFVIGFAIWLISLSGMYVFLRKVIECDITNSIIGSVVFTFIANTDTLFGIGLACTPWVLVILWYIIKIKSSFNYISLISTAVVSGLLISLSTSFIRTLPFVLPLLFIWSFLFFREEKIKITVFFTFFGTTAILPHVPLLISLYEFQDFSHRVSRPLSPALEKGFVGNFYYLLYQSLKLYIHLIPIPALALFYGAKNREQNITVLIVALVAVAPALLMAFLISVSGYAGAVNLYFFLALPFFLVTLAMQLHKTLERREAFVRIPLSASEYRVSSALFLSHAVLIILFIITYSALFDVALFCLICIIIIRFVFEKNIIGNLIWAEKNAIYLRLSSVLLVLLITVGIYQEYKFRLVSVYDWLNNGSAYTALNAEALLTLPPLDLRPYRVAHVVSGQDKGLVNLPSAYGLESADGYTSIYSNRYHAFWRELTSQVLSKDFAQALKFDYWGNLASLQLPDGVEEGTNISEYFNLNLLSLANVEYILSTFPLSTPSLELDFSPEAGPQHYPVETFIERVKRKLFLPFNGRQYFRYKNPFVLDRFRLTGNVETFATSHDLLDRLGNSTITKLSETAYVEDVDSNIIFSSIAPGEGSVYVQEYKADEFTLLIKSDTNQFLVVAITQHPGWACATDNISTPLVPVYHAFWGMGVAKGDSMIKCQFKSSWRRLMEQLN